MSHTVVASRRSTVLVLVSASLFLAIPSRASELSLEDAIQRTAKTHPQLRLFESRQQLLHIDAAEAVLKPGLSVVAEVENLAGSRPYRDADQAEYTLTLAGVLERGMKREARRAVAARRLDILGVERAAAELDVLAEVTRRFLDLLEMSAARPLMQQAVDRQQDLAEAMRRMYLAGGITEAVVLAAEAELARLRGDLAQSEHLLKTRWLRLALLWGEKTPTVPALVPLTPQTHIPEPAPLTDLLAALKEIPDLEYFVTAARLREAERRVVDAERQRDVAWQIGVRHMAGDSATALVAGFSVPLGQPARIDLRADGERIRQQALTVERDIRLLELETLLVQVHAQWSHDRQRLRILDEEILPRLGQAVRQGDRALNAGALSYAELAQLQRELLAAERDRLMTHVNVYRHLVELQRLTAESWMPVVFRSGERP